MFSEGGVNPIHELPRSGLLGNSDGMKRAERFRPSALQVSMELGTGPVYLADCLAI